MRIAIAELLAFARISIAIDQTEVHTYLHSCSIIYQMKEKIMFFIVMYCCYGMFFCSLRLNK